MRPASAIELDRASNGQLEAKGVSVRFEGILALDTVDLTLRPEKFLG